MPAGHPRYISHSRRFSPDLGQVRHEIKTALVAGVQRVNRHLSTRSGVYVGGAGPLVMSWALADFANDIPEVQRSIDIAAISLSRPDSGAHSSFLETSVGTAALTLASYLRAAATRDPKRQEVCAKLIQDTIRLALSESVRDSDDGCEVLYGRAGLLYALLFLRGETQMVCARVSGEQIAADPLVNILGHLCSDKNVTVIVHDIIARGKVGARLYKGELRSRDRELAPPLMWSWHGKRYLGGAHGVAGILQMLLQVSPIIIAPFWDLIIETIDWLIGVQLPSGNWPSKASHEMHNGSDEDHSDELVQCVFHPIRKSACARPCQAPIA